MSRLAPLLGAALLALPRSALACSVCFDASDENRWAFIGTTALLSFLPLVMVGIAVWVLKRRAGRLAADA